MLLFWLWAFFPPSAQTGPKMSWLSFYDVTKFALTPPKTPSQPIRSLPLSIKSFHWLVMPVHQILHITQSASCTYLKKNYTSYWTDHNQLQHRASLLHSWRPSSQSLLTGFMGGWWLQTHPPWRPKCSFKLKEDPCCLSTKETGLSSFTLSVPKQLAWYQSDDIGCYDLRCLFTNVKRKHLEVTFLSVHVQNSCKIT